jgi:hypothetical protein
MSESVGSPERARRPTAFRDGCHSRGVARSACRAPFLATIAIVAASLAAAAPPPYRDDSPQLHHLTVRASAIDSGVQPHPEIEFTCEKDGKPQDTEHAVVDTRVPPRGELVVWLMGYNPGLFERLAAYGMHAVQPHYANRWFGIVKPTDRMARGLIRLEAATGDDVSPQVGIPEPFTMAGFCGRRSQATRACGRCRPSTAAGSGCICSATCS